MTTRFKRAMDSMKALGAADYAEGKPIDAFPGRAAKNKTAAMFPDRARAAYEQGWRGGRDEWEAYCADAAAELAKPIACPHGKPAGDCAACDHLGDLAFDAAREDRIFGRDR